MTEHYHTYHTLVTELEIELDRMHLGRLRDQTQSEIQDRIARSQALLKKMVVLVPHVAPVEKSQRRIDREQEQAARELAAKPPGDVK